MDDKKEKHMRLYFKWGGFIKKLIIDADEKIYEFFKDFQEKAKKNKEFRTGTWSQKFSLKKGRNNQTLGYNLKHLKKYSWNDPRLGLACEDYYEKTGSSATWMVTLYFGGRKPELKKELDEMHIEKDINNSFKGIIYKIETTGSVIRLLLVPGIIERDWNEQQDIILKIWKKLKKIYEEVEK